MGLAVTVFQEMFLAVILKQYAIHSVPIVMLPLFEKVEVSKWGWP
jgi:hypothetical protein